MVETQLGLETDFVMIWTTIKIVIMMMETAVEQKSRKTFVWNANVNVSRKKNWHKTEKYSIQSVCIFLDFTCKTDEDCNGNGYCKVENKLRVCKCYPDYMYALDCSIFSCKWYTTLTKLNDNNTQSRQMLRFHLHWDISCPEVFRHTKACSFETVQALELFETLSTCLKKFASFLAPLG